MGQIFNIYCDESCHLEHDHQEIMVLGAVWCPLEKVDTIKVRIREIKVRHEMSPDFEMKWTKVSPAKKQFYLDVMDYFFDCDDLHFRGLVIPAKSKLQHEIFGQSHDDWYYKMYFEMLKVIMSPEASYRIYLDIKDTRSAVKVKRLHEVLCNNIYDFSRQIIERVQIVRSHEVAILQLADLLIGAISYVNKGLSANTGKQSIVLRMQKRSGYSLIRTTLLRENKVNLLAWKASEELI